MSAVQALIPCTGVRSFEEDHAQAIRTLLSLPHTATDIPCVNKTYSAMLWATQMQLKQSRGALTRVFIPVSFFPEYEEESTCAA